MRKYSKRTIAAVAAVTVAGSGLAYAYWTTGGSGSGTTATGTATANLVVKQVGTLPALVPGLAAQTLSGNFDNPNTSAVYVGTVTASIQSVTPATGLTCTVGDYTLANPTMTVDREIPSGTAQGTWTGATIAFNSKPDVNQDGCKGATVNLSYAISSADVAGTPTP